MLNGRYLLLQKIREGEGDPAELNTIVVSSVMFYLNDESTENPVEKFISEKFVVGEGDIIPGKDVQAMISLIIEFR